MVTIKQTVVIVQNSYITDSVSDRLQVVRGNIIRMLVKRSLECLESNDGEVENIE